MKLLLITVSLAAMLSAAGNPIANIHNCAPIYGDIPFFPQLHKVVCSVSKLLPIIFVGVSVELPVQRQNVALFPA